MTTAVNTETLAKAADAELEDWGPLEEATGHPMATHGVQLWEDGDASAGIWECAPGPVEAGDTRGHLSGRGPDDGDTRWRQVC